ncbi:hypothetical protein J45TS6_04740 [Paenibacillus sp. J45TS6]|uniref:hypothetical protein n=1 Tax=unclassified Paenibacillus TaxID=185978 RepID=UPI001B2835E0|nr:hypothetical protein [Paenibacillus sp. J45TS6]GIP42015.1 hypothetical protein J45TS6_04740 [Paenibacillus sp. J45TS6]
MTDSKKYDVKPVRERIDYPRKEHQHGLRQREEYAAELTSPLPGTKGYEEPVESKEEGTKTESLASYRIGYLGLAISFISLFVWSFVLGTIGIVLGYYAFKEGRRTVGGWAVGIGIAALLSYSFLVMFTYYQ